MRKMGDYIKELRTKKGLTQEQLGGMLTPPVNKAAINKWEKGHVENIKRAYIAQMAMIFNVNPVDLMCFEDNVFLDSAVPVKETKKIPVVGRVAAGVPILASENIVDYITVPDGMDTADLFALVISGDSMSPRIQDGDLVVVRKGAAVETGDIVIARINGENATCKKLRLHPDGLELIPLNMTYEPMFFTSRQVEGLPVVIVGKVIELRSRL